MGLEDGLGSAPSSSNPDSPRDDLKERERQFREQLAEVGLDQVRMMYERPGQNQNPLNFLWMQRWIAEQELAMRAAEAVRLSKHETNTRRIAVGALLVAITSAVAALGSWLFPRK